MKYIEKIHRFSWELTMRVFQAFIAIGLWLLWVNYGPTLKEIAQGFAAIPFHEFRDAISLR